MTIQRMLTPSRLRLLFSLLVGLLLLHTPLYALPTVQLKQELNISNGLVHNGVTSLMQDSKGYLWVGTYDGLCRYNGSTTTIFKNRIDTRIFNSNRVRSLCEDKNGAIWIGTDLGISVFSYKNHQIKRLPLPNGYQEMRELIVRSLIPSADGTKIYAAVENEGIFVYDTAFNLLYSTTERGIIPLQGKGAVAIAENLLLLPTTRGLQLYNDTDRSLTPILAKEISAVVDVDVLDDQTLAVLLDYGMYKVNYTMAQKGGKRVDSRFELAIPTPIYPDYKFVRLAVDEDGVLWLGMDATGLACMDNYNEQLGRVPLEFVRRNLRVGGFLFLEDGAKWVTSFDQGILRYSTEAEIFTSITSLEGVGEVKQSLLAQLDDDRILVQPYYKDLCLLNIKTGKQESLLPLLTPDELKSPSSLFQIDDEVWIFKNERAILKLREDKVERVKTKGLEQLPQFSVPTTAGKDGSGNLWLGYPSNLYRLTLQPDGSISALETVHLNPYFSAYNISRVRVIYWDEVTESLWVGTDSQGLYRIILPANGSLVQAKVTHYMFEEGDRYALPSNFVSCIKRHPNGELWIGTEQGGVCRVEEDDDGMVRFENFTESASLMNDVIKSFLIDPLDRMWVATNVGLHMYDDTKRLFLNFYTADGLPFEDFWYSSLCVESHNRLFFSGVQGFCTFDATQFPQSDKLPNLEFPEVSLFDQQIRPFEKVGKSVLFTTSISEGDKLRLKHDQNGITIQVDALYGSLSSNHRIRYQLLPMSDKWQTLPSNVNSISLNGLSPGTYTLRVVASDALLNWTAPKDLTIIVSPPWWKTPVAYTIYIILLLLAIVSVVQILMRFQQLNHNLEIEALEKRNLESINEEKQRYFSNISHELKTPLTLIFAPLDSLMQQFKVDVEVRKKLHIIKRQSRKMLGLIDLAHNVQLNEMNILRKEVSQFEFVRFMQSVTADFTFLAEYDQKQLSIAPISEEEIYVEADKSMLEKVINNLLNNSFKYTRPSDSITVRYGVVNGVLRLTVADTGYGIDSKDVPYIFDRFYQGKHNTANIGGTGIGLTFSRRLVMLHGGNITVESELDKGSTFEVLLPIVIPAHARVESQDPIEEVEDLMVKQGGDESFIIGESSLESRELSDELRGSTLFVVEDNVELRQFMNEFLSPYFNVQMFTNGMECLEQMKENWPDIIVSDVMMPVMDGYELCKTVKSDIKTSHIPFILLTALTTVDDKIKGLEYGADAYIPKPFYPKHLFKRIETLLRGRLLLRERYQIGIPLVLNDSKGTAAKDNEFLERLYDLFSQNLDNDEVDVYSFAVDLGLNRSFFLQKVKALTNHSPYELLKNYRLTRAAKLLQENGVNVNEVCLMTGFKSRTHFSRLFKEKYGASPSKYAQACEEGLTDAP